MCDNMPPIPTEDITIEHLSVAFRTGGQSPKGLDDISLCLPVKKITGILGESGCGKSLLAMSLLGLLPDTANCSGNIRFNNQSLGRLSNRDLRKLRQQWIALIPQNPDVSLNPLMKIRDQIREGMIQEKNGRSDAIIDKVLNNLGISQRGSQYPFQLSGGMKQRALAAIALCRNPLWLLADEPTKGLDARLRYTICKLLERIHLATTAGIILISHDLAFARRLCHYIAVLYCGKLMETAPAPTFFSTPGHPYSRALLKALPENGFHPIPGIVPGIAQPPRGCPFHPRCPDKMDICRDKMPGAGNPRPGQTIYCHQYA